MKRRISDMLDQVQPESVELNINSPLSAERIRELTMSRISTQKPKRRWGTRLLLAAVIMVLMTMTIFAAEEIMTYDNWLEDYFSGKEVVAEISQSQLELLDQGLVTVDQSVTSGGYTVTLETAITDGYVAYLTFRVDAPAGVVLDGGHYGFREIPMGLFGKDSVEGTVGVASGGWKMLEDADPADGTIRLVLI